MAKAKSRARSKVLTPLVNIIGLYSNVPEGGEIKPPQTDWLVSELKAMPKNVPVFVALHHPIYSADTYHSGSTGRSSWWRMLPSRRDVIRK